MTLLNVIAEDMRRNIFFKSKFVIVLFRFANYFANLPRPLSIFGAPIIGLYIFVSEWILGIEIHPKTKIGPGLCIYHGFGIVVNGYTKIGSNCTLRQCVTLGNIVRRNGTITGAPVIGDYVEFGSHSQALGQIIIGSNSRIGAGAVVLSDVPSNSTAVGVPAHIISA